MGQAATVPSFAVSVSLYCQLLTSRYVLNHSLEVFDTPIYNEGKCRPLRNKIEEFTGSALYIAYRPLAEGVFNSHRLSLALAPFTFSMLLFTVKDRQKNVWHFKHSRPVLWARPLVLLRLRWHRISCITFSTCK